MFVIGTKIFVYGGWNTAYQFETLFHYDTSIGEWWEPEVNGQDIVPVWNHSACLVQAIPSAKYFVFGGESTAFPEGGPRGFGEYSNHIRYLDTADSFKWSKVTTEDAHLKTAVFPKPREYSSMSYDAKNSRLIIFGGWANEWLNDVYILNISSVVGPPYSISEIVPRMGQLSGGTEVTIKGIGFKETGGINIRFTCGKNWIEIPGEYKSETEITAITKSFEEIGPKEAEVRLQMEGKDFTTSAVIFTYFMNTRAHKSLAYGPGLIDGAAIGSQACFVV